MGTCQGLGIIIFFMEKETKNINWEQDFLYTTEKHQQLRKHEVYSNNNKSKEDNLKESIHNIVFPISTSKLLPITNVC